MGDAETIVQGLGLIEGPVWREAQGDLIITAIRQGRVLRIDVDTGTAAVFADVAGGPNGAYPCADGGVIVANNGGLDWEAVGRAVTGAVGTDDARPPARASRRARRGAHRR